MCVRLIQKLKIARVKKTKKGIFHVTVPLTEELNREFDFIKQMEVDH